MHKINPKLGHSARELADAIWAEAKALESKIHPYDDEVQNLKDLSSLVHTIASKLEDLSKN